MSAFLGELIGTMLLLIFGGGVVAGVILKGTKAESAGWIVITSGWGLAVAIAIYAVGTISGAHLNPAVTISLACAGDFAWELVPAYILAQFAGAFIGAVIVWIHYLPHWKETKDPGTQLAVFATGPAIHKTWSNLLSEIIGTFILMFGLSAIGANKFSDGLNPLVIGGFIVAIGLSLGATTGYAINPARDLGPRIAHFLLPIAGKGSSDWKYAWIPVVGPILGGILGSLLYKALFKQEIYSMLYVIALATLLVAFLAIRENKHKQE
ncbi:MAG: MIP/aquaporin family protein [Bacteroidia bacterium]